MKKVSCLTVASRRPNRVIEFACFDSKLQWERSTCELKQPKRRECLPRAVSNTAFIFVTKDPQITQASKSAIEDKLFGKNNVH